jgi:hypothetical protein
VLRFAEGQNRVTPIHQRYSGNFPWETFFSLVVAIDWLIVLHQLQASPSFVRP